jgi:hypothetical protein
MSHRPRSNSGQYYDSTNQGPNVQHSLNSNQQSTHNNAYSTQASYPGDIRQPPQSQYGSSGYDWNAQNSPTYPNSSRRSTYQTETWKEGGAPNGPYEQRMQANNYATQAAAGPGTGDYYSSRDPNAQGLNNLAYASGLDNTDAQGTDHHVRRPSLTNGSQYSAQPVANTSQRIQSPVNQHTNRQGAGHPSNYPYHRQSPSVSASKAPVSAATALAGAVSRRYHQPSGSTRQPAGSPLIDNSRSAVPKPQKTASPYHHVTATVAKVGQSPDLPQANFPTSNHTSQGSFQQRQQSLNSVQNKRQLTTTNREKQLSHPVTSISNLVTHTDADDNSQAQYHTSVDGQSDMPGYIDPTQVFNPFHKEHEQRRIEAARAEAEAEARKKAEAEAQAGAARRAKEDQEASSRARENEKVKAPKKPPTKSRSKPQAQSNATKPDPPEAIIDSNEPHVPSEEEMANEMKVMMEKMKEFRSKDPSMFQKLWDSMRGVSQGTAAASTAPVQSPSPQLTEQPPLSPQQKESPILHKAQQQPIPQVAPTQSSIEASTKVQTTRTPHGTSLIAESGRTITKHRLTKLNGYRVVVENNPERLPNLGRFPAERRIRTGQNKKNNSEIPSRQLATTEGVGLDSSGTAPTSTSAPASSIDTSGPISIAGPVPKPAPTPVPGPSPPPESISTLVDNAKPAQDLALSQGLPPKGLVGGTIWPEDKRNALAEAAVRALKEFSVKGYPGNAKIEITPKDIHAILEANPSYIDLCEILEKKGFKFHRGQFARQLLTNVPYLNAPPAAKRIQPSEPVVQATIPPTRVGGPPPPPPPDRPLPPPTVHRQAVPPPHGIPPHPLPPGAVFVPAPAPSQFHAANQGPQLIKPQRRPPHPQQYMPAPRPPKGQTFAPLRNEPPLGSKEAMARKRDFSELIDLTGLSDNEDYVLSKKHARIEKASPEPDLFQEYNMEMMSRATNQPEFPLGSTQAGQPLRFDPGSRQTGQIPPRQSSPNGSGVETLAARSRRHAKPINRVEGLKKNYYDPKTVARDILIAAGRHPTERPLNAHMAGLLGRHIDIDSDLATFDWDAIDPGGPPMPMVDYFDVSAGPPQYQLGQRVDVQMVDRRSSSKERAGRLPNSDKRAAKGHLPNGASAAAAPSIAPTSESMANPLHQAANSMVKRLSILRHSHVPGPDVAKDPSLPSHLSSQPKSSPQSSSSQPPSVTTHTMISNEAAIPKRRGRPPGAKSKNMSVAAMHRAARQVTSVTSPSPSGPHLPVFRCRWKGCRAHLHNSETLRQHISKLHGQLEDNTNEYACWWKKCQFLKEDSECMWEPVQTFSSHQDWLKHIERDHIFPITLKQGDGPSTKHIGKPIKPSFDVSRFRFLPPLASKTRTTSYLDPQTILMDKTRYLSDENGRSTTPMISAQSNRELEPDTMTLLAADHDQTDEAAQRSFIKTHRDDKSSPKAIAEETLRSLGANKANFGPGMKDEGCILVRESVKFRLAQNPAITRVTEAAD